MPSLWSKLEDAMSDECDRVYGETWTFAPMKSVSSGRSAPDGSRTLPSGVTGILEAKMDRSTEFGSEARGSRPVTVTRPRLSVDARHLPPSQLPQRLDRVTRDETGEAFEISQRERDQDGRYLFHLKKIMQA